MDFKGKIICNHVAGDPPQNFTLSTCPKCRGRGWHGGITFTKLGKIETVSGVDQLKQHLEKILIEKVRNTGYGLDYDLFKGTIDRSTLNTLKAEISRVMNYYVNTQQRNERNGFIYNPTERLVDVDVNIIQDSSNPRNILINVTAETQSKKEISFTVPIRRNESA